MESPAAKAWEGMSFGYKDGLRLDTIVGEAFRIPWDVMQGIVLAA